MEVKKETKGICDALVGCTHKNICHVLERRLDIEGFGSRPAILKALKWIELKRQRLQFHLASIQFSHLAISEFENPFPPQRLYYWRS